MAKSNICTRNINWETGVETFTFAENAGVVEFDYNKCSDEMKRQLGIFGANHKIGDTFAGKTPQEGHERAATMAERLLAGEWAKERESAGPRPSMVVDAVVAVLVAAGQEVDDKRRAGIVKKTSGKEARERTLANPKYKAAYEELKAKAAADRAKAAKAAAKESDADLGDF